MNNAREEAEQIVASFENCVNEKDFFGDNVRFKNQKNCARILIKRMIEQQQSQEDDMNWSCVGWWKRVLDEVDELYE